MTATMSQAIEEAYASAEAEALLLDTLELRHPALLDPDTELPDPIRVVCDTRAWELKLEAAAPLQGGETVTFRHALFGLDLPDSTDAVPQARVWVDAVDRAIVGALEQIVTIRAPIEVTYRCYIAPGEGDPTPEPGYLIEGLKLRNVRVGLQRMSGDLTFDVLSNRAFPNRIYTRREFPGLYR